MSAEIKKKLKKAHAFLDAKKFQQSFAMFQEVLQLDGKEPDALYHMGRFAQASGNFPQAVQFFQTSLMQDNNRAEVHQSLGVVYEDMREFGLAAEHYLTAARLDPKPFYYYNFSSVIKHLRYTEANPQLLDVLAFVMAQESVEADGLFGVWFSLFNKTEIYQLLLTLADQTTPPSTTDVEILSQNQPLILMLCNALVQTAPLEQALTKIRAKILLRHWPLNEVPVIFLAALALQGFHNEYVWFITDAEKQAMEALNSKVASGAINLPELFLLAAYCPLYRVPKIESCKGLLAADDFGFAANLWQEQVLEPLVEQKISYEIKVLTPIHDLVSQNVQAQYEENPYPRWKTIFSMGNISFIRNMELNFPYISPNIFNSIPHAPKVLIAGCGTGRQPLAAANVFKDQRITAVDLSKASLAYAIRKSRELGLEKNVEFGQADILCLEQAFPPASFDMVQCTGVLHHMENPMAGWEVICNLLKPKGFMKIALYSKSARSTINKMREKIAKENISSTPDDIREFRHKVMENTTEAPWYLGIRDFYAMSECRDLLFHVQEQQFTILEIKAALEKLNLEWMGFEFDNKATLHNFSHIFPNAQKGGSLDQWHQFEETNPGIFAGMYQFWVQKR